MTGNDVGRGDIPANRSVTVAARQDSRSEATVPELPDIAVYIEALEKRILGQPLEHVRLARPYR